MCLSLPTTVLVWLHLVDAFLAQKKFDQSAILYCCYAQLAEALAVQPNTVAANCRFRALQNLTEVPSGETKEATRPESGMYAGAIL